MLRIGLSRLLDILGRTLRPPPPPEPFPHGIEVILATDVALETDDIRATGGERRGFNWWWLRPIHDGPLPLALPRGDVTFAMPIKLIPGRYVLGTGRGQRAIRIGFEVTKSGDVKQLWHHHPRRAEGRKSI